MKNTLIIAFLFFAISLSSQEKELDIQQLQIDIVYLSSDYLEGRETGKRGEKLAAKYIISRFKEIGLVPKGTGNNWLQPFQFKFNNNPHAAEKDKLSGIGNNVIGYIDNDAANTVIIGAHFDHLGYGNFGSRHVGDPQIHNGADDNASGVAALLKIAEHLKNSTIKNNNYLFIAFSGEEMGLVGSKYFSNNPTIDWSKVSYMFNMDMVGKLNEERVLAVLGVGTSPAWKPILEKIKVHNIKTKMGESGIGPSDHTSFYLKNIPVLHFFTGQHTAYHKPEDDANTLNFQGLFEVTDFIIAIIEKLNDSEKLAFTKTKDEKENRKVAAFKVSLGVMPDYVFDGEGMRIDAVIDGRPAAKAGLEDGDIILQIGSTKVKDIYDYMDGLNKFKSGQKAKVKVMRKGEILKKEVVF